MLPVTSDRAGRVFGRLLLTTVHQASNGPRVDAARAADAEGRTYGALVLGTGRHAPVLGWRGANVPPPARIAFTAPRPLRPVARWLFTPRPGRAAR